MKEPWKRDTNDKYSEVVKTIMGLSTASLLLPVFFARDFLSISPETSLTEVFGWTIYLAWALLALSILSGVFFIYLSAKWIRIAWGKNAGIFWSRNTKESTLERFMETTFWANAILFSAGLLLTILFFICYATD